MRNLDLLSFKATIGRLPYASIGVGAFLLKFALDHLIVEVVFDREWSLLNYWVSPFGPVAPGPTLGTDRGIVTALLALALPFIWLGVVLTIRRLRSIGWAPCRNARGRTPRGVETSECRRSPSWWQAVLS